MNVLITGGAGFLGLQLARLLLQRALLLAWKGSQRGLTGAVPLDAFLRGQAGAVAAVGLKGFAGDGGRIHGSLLDGACRD